MTTHTTTPAPPDRPVRPLPDEVIQPPPQSQPRPQRAGRTGTARPMILTLAVLLALAAGLLTPVRPAAAQTGTLRCLGFGVPNAIRAGELPVRYTAIGTCPLLPGANVNAAFVMPASDNLAFCAQFAGAYFPIPAGFVAQPRPEWTKTDPCIFDSPLATNTSVLQRLSSLGNLSSVNAASFTTPLAPGIATAASGVNLAATSATAPNANCVRELARTVIYVVDRGGERQACLLAVAPGQINFELPPEALSNTSDTVVLAYRRDLGRFVAFGRTAVAPGAPGVFTRSQDGKGTPSAYVLRVRADGSQVTETVDQPIRVGQPGERVFLVLYATGLRNRSSVAAVTASVGGQTANATYAGPSGYRAVEQVNLELPPTLAQVHGQTSLTLTVDGRRANTVTVALA